jgi:hypothetical protein
VPPAASTKDSFACYPPHVEDIEEVEDEGEEPSLRLLSVLVLDRPTKAIDDHPPGTGRPVRSDDRGVAALSEERALQAPYPLFQPVTILQTITSGVILTVGIAIVVASDAASRTP